MVNTALTTTATNIKRVKYFRIPLYLTNMIPNVVYTAAVGGVNIGPWCKPDGGVLGGPLTSDATGKLRLTYHLSIPYNTSFLTTPNINVGLLQNKMLVTFTDPLGGTSITYLPITMKSN